MYRIDTFMDGGTAFIKLSLYSSYVYLDPVHENRMTFTTW